MWVWEELEGKSKGVDECDLNTMYSSMKLPDSFEVYKQLSITFNNNIWK